MSDLERLPIIGVGASLSFGVPPDPVVLAQMPGGPDFIEYAGSVDASLYAQEIAQLHHVRVPTLFHPSCLNLCGPWKNPPSWLEKIHNHVQYVSSPWLAQDVSICFVDEPGYSIQLGYFVGPILSRESLEEAVQRVLEVRQYVNVPLLLEPPPATWKIGDMSMMNWLNELAQRTGCGLLIDAGHLYAHCLVEKRNLLSDIDFSRVIEVHVAGGSIGVHNKKKYYTDDHRLPIQPEVWAIFDKLLSACENLRAVCYECEGTSAAEVLPVLDIIRKRVLQHTNHEALRDFVVGRMAGKERMAILPSIVSEHAPKPLPINIDAGYSYVLRLLFDSEVRHLLKESSSDCAQELGCSPSFLDNIDITGVELDAQGRAEYLMSSLCRLFPWSATLVGSAPSGMNSLAQFLSSPSILGDMDVRNNLFADHLSRIVSFLPIASTMKDAILAFVEVERGLARNRADLRKYMKDEGIFPSLPSSQRKEGVFHFAPYTVIAQLPFSTLQLHGLMGCSSEQVWRIIQGGGFGWDKIQAILRADTQSSTFLCTAIPKGYQAQRAIAGAIAPSLEIEQKTIELTGAAFLPMSQLQNKPHNHLTEEQQKYAEQLVEHKFGYFSSKSLF